MVCWLVYLLSSLSDNTNHVVASMLTQIHLYVWLPAVLSMWSQSLVLLILLLTIAFTTLWSSSCSSHTVQIVSTWDWTWDLQTTAPMIQNTGRNGKHWLPKQTDRANIWHQQLWRIIQQVGIRNPTIWIKQIYQIKPKWQFWWTEQEDHCSNIYIWMQEHHQHTQR